MNEKGKQVTVEFLLNHLAVEDGNTQHKFLSQLDSNSSMNMIAYVTSTVFESKDEPTQMTKQSFTIIYFITYKETIHFKLICINVHS